MGARGSKFPHTSRHSSSDAPAVDKLKVVLLGEAAVGKTSLFKRLMGVPLDVGYYVPSTTAGVGAKLVQVEGHRPVVFELWDVPPQSFAGPSIYARYFRRAHAVVLVYSLADPPSWRVLPRYLQAAQREITSGESTATKQPLPVVMVGCKSDGKESTTEATTVLGEARAWCNEHKIEHVEVSSTGEYSSTLDVLKLILKQLP